MNPQRATQAGLESHEVVVASNFEIGQWHDAEEFAEELRDYLLHARAILICILQRPILVVQVRQARLAVGFQSSQPPDDSFTGKLVVGTNGLTHGS